MPSSCPEMLVLKSFSSRGAMYWVCGSKYIVKALRYIENQSSSSNSSIRLK